MNKEKIMLIFEQSCADLGLDFTKDTSIHNDVCYTDYQTGVTFGAYLLGFKDAEELFRRHE